MSLDSGVLARSFRIAADEMTKLAPFIDDLDGVGGGDCDTGTNARVTFEALAHSLNGLGWTSQSKPEYVLVWALRNIDRLDFAVLACGS